MSDFDVLIVGGGPAGSTAARELAAAGARTLVVDREVFPRYKPCGGGIPIKVRRALPFPLDSVVEQLVDTLTVSFLGSPRFSRRSRGPFAAMVMRDRFDALLLEHAERAGARLRTGSPVVALEAGSVLAVTCRDGFRATAPFLVCADGAHSPVGTMLGLGDGIAECAAWEIEFRAPPAEVRARGRRVSIDIGYRPWGYGWLFPKGEGLSAGLVLPREKAALLRPSLDDLLDRWGVGGLPVSVKRGHKIRFRRGREPIAGERAVLVGDAAGLADEFTQEGIFYAIQSGRIAARSVLRAMGGAGTVKPYEEEIDREIMPELRAARFIGRLFYAGLRRAPRPWLAASRLTPGLWSSFFAVQQGESSYQREVRRLPFPLRGPLERALRL